MDQYIKFVKMKLGKRIPSASHDNCFNTSAKNMRSYSWENGNKQLKVVRNEKRNFLLPIMIELFRDESNEPFPAFLR